MDAAHVTAQQLYSKLSSDREPFLEAARQAALVTIPRLMPEWEDQEESEMAQPFQSVGADGVNNMAASLLLTIFPPQEPFFRFEVTPEGKDEIREESGGDPQTYERILSEIKVSLARYERRVVRRIEKERLRPALGEALKHLIVAGNVAIDYGETKNDKARTFRMDQYVVERMGDGRVFRGILREQILKEALTPELRALAAVPEMDMGDQPVHKDSRHVFLYTVVERLDPMKKGPAKFRVWQEIDKEVIPDSEEIYTEAECPVKFYWFTPNFGSNWSVGYVDQYMGDLKSLEGLSEAMVEGAAVAARCVTGVDPTGFTNVEEVKNADNLDVIAMRQQDVFMLRADKGADMAVVFQTTNRIVDRLNRAFIIPEGAVRDAERVTAEEIRLMRQAIERKLGNVYGILTEEVQVPLLDRMLAQMQTDGELPDEIDEGIDYVIVAGVDALGRANELERLRLFLGSLMEMSGDPMTLNNWVRMSGLINRLAILTGVEHHDFLRSEEEVEARMQQQQQQQMIEKLGPNVVNQGGQMMQAQMAAGQEAE